MKEIEEILAEIEKLRKKMDDMIESKEDLLDREILEISRLLDKHLVKYYKLTGFRNEKGS